MSSDEGVARERTFVEDGLVNLVFVIWAVGIGNSLEWRVDCGRG